jgi:hypothetical protein
MARSKKLPGTQLNEKLLRIIRTSKYISSKAYDPTTDAFRQMDSLVDQVHEAAAFMQTLKPQEEDTTQQSLLFDPERALGEEVHSL